MKSTSRPFPGSPRAACVSLALTICAALLASAVPASAVTITVKSADGAGEGFNDNTGVAPVGGNPKTTLGQQRMYVFQYAADIWGLRLDGELPVVVRGVFDNLGGNSVSATLGFAAPNTVHRDFLGAPEQSTWYVAALANQHYGTDLNDLTPGSCPTPLIENKCAEIRSQFNASVDNQTVLGAVDFYYGLDGNAGSDIDFLTVALHEIGHGLGIISLVDSPVSGTTPDIPPGSLYFNFADSYSRLLQDPEFSPSQFHMMANNQRVLAMVDDEALVLAGSSVKNRSSALLDGKRNDGAVQAFAPSTFISGSSTSHFDVDAFPDELMEPFFTTSEARDLHLSLGLLEDVGWDLNDVPRCGDPNDDGNFSASDSLIVLKGAVGSTSCPKYACDVNGAGGVTAGDALILLKYAVGQSVTLECPLI